MEQEELVQTEENEQEPKKKRRPALWFTTFIAVVIVLFFGINYFLVHNDIQNAESQSKKLTEQIDLVSATVAKEKKVPENVLKEATAYAKGEKFLMTPVFDALLKDAPTEASLTGVTFNDANMQIKMNFSTLQDATTYEKALTTNKNVFEKVEMEKVAAYTPATEDELAAKPDISSTARYQAVFNLTLNKAALEQAQEKAGDK